MKGIFTAKSHKEHKGGSNFSRLFYNCRFSLFPGPVSEYGMTFFHRDRLSFPRRRESTKKAPISRWIPAGAGIACPGEGQERRRKIIQSAIWKFSQFFSLCVLCDPLCVLCEKFFLRAK